MVLHKSRLLGVEKRAGIHVFCELAVPSPIVNELGDEG